MCCANRWDSSPITRRPISVEARVIQPRARLHAQTTRSRRHHGLVHRYGDIRRDARRAGRSAVRRTRAERADPRKLAGALRARQASARAVRDLHRETCCAATSASPTRSKIGASTTSFASTSRYPRRSECSRSTSRAFGGIVWGALTALYRNRLPDIVIMFLVIVGVSVPSFVVAALSQLGARQAEFGHGSVAVARGGLGHVAAHARAVDRSRPRHDGLPHAAHALVDARDREFGFRPHGARQRLAAAADLF